MNTQKEETRHNTRITRRRACNIGGSGRRG